MISGLSPDEGCDRWFSHVKVSRRAALLAAGGHPSYPPLKSTRGLPGSTRRLSGLIVALPPSLQELINRRIKGDPGERRLYSTEEEPRAPAGPGPLICDVSLSVSVFQRCIKRGSVFIMCNCCCFALSEEVPEMFAEAVTSLRGRGPSSRRQSHVLAC